MCVSVCVSLGVEGGRARERHRRQEIGRDKIKATMDLYLLEG